MLLLLKDHSVLKISENGFCQIRDFDRLPFALRRENITFPDFVEWVSNRSLSVGRSHAKAVLNSLGLSQTNRYAVCLACRGVSLEDAYWIRQEGDERCWKDVNLFHNELSLFLTELALSGENTHQNRGEKMVKSRLFTSEDVSLVTFEEFSLFCEHYGLNPYEQAVNIDSTAYLRMQIGDCLLNNDARYGQNWGFFMDNHTGKMSCPDYLEEDRWQQVLARARRLMTRQAT